MKKLQFLWVFIGFALIISACAPAQADIPSVPPLATSTVTPGWFDIELTDALSGKTFKINDFAGKVILIETMAIWCPNCIVQATQVSKLHENIGNQPDFITISLDVDYNEDTASLKEYVDSYKFDWRFAVAPLEVARALGNLYNAEYLNPPLSPMLLIDRTGSVHQLKYGLKDADTLQKIIEPYLSK